MVNYDAFRLYFSQLRGQCFGTTLAGLGVETVCLITMSDDVRDYESIRYQFLEKINRHNPQNSLAEILFVITDKENEQRLKNEQLFNILRMQLADAYAVSLLCPHVKRMIVQPLSIEEHAELIRLLDLALDNYYYYPGEADLPLYLAPIFYTLGNYKRSLFCWRISALYEGLDVKRCLGAALCYEKMDLLSDAIDHYEMAIQLDPDSPLAEKALNSINSLKENRGLTSQSE